MANKQRITTDIKVPNKNLEALRKNFGQCFDKNGDFDIERFKQELSENEIDFYKESYGLDWLGKSYARILASDEATTLLKEDEEHNKKEKNINSRNLLIKGDNLEVLKHLSNAYYEKISMIYIDPPYNTGSDGFVYWDDRKFTIDELKKLAGVDEEKAKRILDFTKSKSNSHSAWLTFMYPRLYIAKQLLSEEGVIFASIDENEVSQLRLLMDEIFGEENFVAILPRITTTKGKNDEKQIALSHDYVIIYSKMLSFSRNDNFISLSRYKLEDEIGRYYLEAPLDAVSLQYSEQLDFPIEIDGKTFKPLVYNGKKTSWRWSKDLVEFGIKNNVIVPKNDRLYTKTYLNYVIKKNENNDYAFIEKDVGITNRSLLLVDYAYSNNEASRYLKSLGIPFDYCKPISLIIKLHSLLTNNKNDIILDFFAGSGTTGDAVMRMNTEDGGSRQFILVQLPEIIDSKKDKTAFEFVAKELKADPTVFEITKERLIRSARKVKEENIESKIAGNKIEINKLNESLDLEDKQEKINQLQSEIDNLKNQDLGFKIFETMPIWDEYGFEADELNPQAELFDESKLTDEDIKALLITWKTYDGIALTEILTEIDLCGYTGYFANGKLYLMNKGFSTDSLKHLLEKIDTDKNFNPTSIVAFGYHFESKSLREISENIKSYANKKHIDIDFVTRY